MKNRFHCTRHKICPAKRKIDESEKIILYLAGYDLVSSQILATESKNLVRMNVFE